MATLDQIRRLTVTGRTDGMEAVERSLNAVDAAQRRVEASSSAVSSTTKETSGSVLSAERDFTRMARSLDPVARAQAAFERGMRLGNAAIRENAGYVEQHQRNMAILTERLEQARAAAQRFNQVQAQARSPVQQRIDDAIGITRPQQSRGDDVEAWGKRLEDLRQKYAPLSVAGEEYRNRVNDIREALNAGIIKQSQYTVEMAKAKAETKDQVAAIRATTGAANDNTRAIGLQKGALQQLSFQANDAATMLLSGSSAFQVFATQGGQVFQILQQGPNGVMGSIKGIGTAISGLLTPAKVTFGLIGALVISGTAAWYKYDDAVRTVERSMNGIGRASGRTLADLTAIAQKGTASGLSAGSSYAAVSAFTGAGIRGDVTEQLVPLIKPYSRKFGLAEGDAQESMLRAVASPATVGLEELAKRFGPLSVAFTDQVRTLEAMGRSAEAQMMVAAKFKDEIAKATDNTNAFWKAMDSAKTGISSYFFGVGQRLAGPTRDERIGELNQLIQARSANPNSQPYLKAVEERARLIAERDKEAAEGAKKAQAAEEEFQRNRQSAIEKTRFVIGKETDANVASILARTASERLAADVMKLQADAIRDTTKQVQLQAEIQRANALATAEATRAMRDFNRSLRDEFALGGAKTDAERIRIQTAIDFREQAKKEDILRNPPASLPAQPAQPATGGPSAATGGSFYPAGTTPSFAKSGGLDPEFARRLQALFDAVSGLSVTSGFRTTEQQAALYAQKPGWAAPPGRSNHERGLAADLAFKTPEAKQLAHELAAQFGLAFPLKNRWPRPEDWHVEMAKGTAPAGAGVSGPREVTIPGGRIYTQDEVVKTRINQQIVEPFFRDWDRSLEGQKRALESSKEMFGQSEEAIASNTARMRAELELHARLGPAAAKYTAEIEKRAIHEGLIAADMKRTQDQQQKYIATLDSLRSSTNDLISSPLKAWARGENPKEALRAAGQRFGERMIDQGTTGITDMLLGKQGKADSGLIGALLGLGGDKNTATMSVKAGIVNVDGGLGGAGGGSGGLFGLIGKAFGFGGGGNSSEFDGFDDWGSTTNTGWVAASARGNIFMRGQIQQFVNGGVMTEPVSFPMTAGRRGTAVEEGPESIMPLGRNSSGKLGVLIANPRGKPNGGGGGGMQVSYRGGDLIIQGSVNEDVMPKVEALVKRGNDEVLKQVKKYGSTWNAQRAQDRGV